MPASQHSRRAVSAAMAVRCSISQRPARPSASTSASTWTTISWRSGASAGESPGSNIRSAIHASASARRTVRQRPPNERPTWDVGQEYLGVFSPVGSGSFPSTGIGGCIAGVCVLSRRPTWDVLRCQAFVVPPRRGLFRRMDGHRGIERAQDARTHLWREPPVQHHGAVVLVPEGEAAVLVLGIGPLGLFGALRPAMQADEHLHMLGGAVQSDVEEVGFVLRGGNAGQRSNLGVTELAPGERLGEQRQLGQCPCDTNLLSRGMGVDAAGPAQPVGPTPRGDRARR